eukprot:7277566-Pyramimonas_sp.AAC.1
MPPLPGPLSPPPSHRGADVADRQRLDAPRLLRVRPGGVGRGGLPPQGWQRADDSMRFRRADCGPAHSVRALSREVQKRKRHPCRFL